MGQLVSLWHLLDYLLSDPMVDIPLPLCQDYWMEKNRGVGGVDVAADNPFVLDCFIKSYSFSIDTFSIAIRDAPLIF